MQTQINRKNIIIEREKTARQRRREGRRREEDQDGTRRATGDEEGTDTPDDGGDGDGKVAYTRFCVGRCALSQGKLLSFGGGGGSSKEAGQRNGYARGARPTGGTHRVFPDRDQPLVENPLGDAPPTSNSLLSTRSSRENEREGKRKRKRTVAGSRNRELLVGPLSFPARAYLSRELPTKRGIGPAGSFRETTVANFDTIFRLIPHCTGIESLRSPTPGASSRAARPSEISFGYL